MPTPTGFPDDGSPLVGKVAALDRERTHSEFRCSELDARHARRPSAKQPPDATSQEITYAKKTPSKLDDFSAEGPGGSEPVSNVGKISQGSEREALSIQHSQPGPGVEMKAKRCSPVKLAAKTTKKVRHGGPKASWDADMNKSGTTVLTTKSIRPMDIICNRGRPYHKHPGNVRFLAIVDAHRDVYDAASRREKTSIAAMVVEVVRSSQFGGYCGQADGQSQNSASASASAGCEDVSSARFLRRFIQGKQNNETAHAKAGTEDPVLQDCDDESKKNFALKANDSDFDTDEVWFEVSDAVAIDKASHALRSKYRTVRYSVADVHAAVQKSSKHNKPDISRARLSPPPVDKRPHSALKAPPSATRQVRRQDSVVDDASNDNEAVSTAEHIVARPTAPPIAVVTADLSQDRVQNDRAPTIDRATHDSHTTVNRAVMEELQRELFLTSQLLSVQYERARQIAHAELAEQHALAVFRASHRTALAGLVSPLGAVDTAAAGILGGVGDIVRPSLAPFASLMQANCHQLTMDPRLSLGYSLPPTLPPTTRAVASSMDPQVIQPFLNANNSIVDGQSIPSIPSIPPLPMSSSLPIPTAGAGQAAVGADGAFLRQAELRALTSRGDREGGAGALHDLGAAHGATDGATDGGRWSLGFM